MNRLRFPTMHLYRIAMFCGLLATGGLAATFPLAGQTATTTARPATTTTTTRATGKLILSGDLNLFAGRGAPNNCVTTNRFKRGENVGFRITAVDGGTGEVEKSAVIVVHVTHGGKTVDVPMNFRGADPKAPGAIPYLWTGKWVVPADAPIGIVRFKATAKDAKGRTAEWTVFQNAPQAQLTIVE
jgi:hypothetical protein